VSELALQAKTKAELAVNEMNQMVRIGHPMIRLAGLSGATAVILGAYGAHGNRVSPLRYHIYICLSVNLFSNSFCKEGWHP